ncbi:hypothetical protein HHI36_005912, partial [Cryptolaemus montrouzieri]
MGVLKRPVSRVNALFTLRNRRQTCDHLQNVRMTAVSSAGSAMPVEAPRLNCNIVWFDQFGRRYKTG